MEVEIRGGILHIKAKVNCLECQYLHRPNPAEDVFMCLRSLKTVTHELDELKTCKGFDDLRVHWIPTYSERVGNYV